MPKLFEKVRAVNGARIWVLFAVTLALLIAATALLVSSALRRIKSATAETVAGESLYREVMDRAVREHVDPIDAEARCTARSRASSPSWIRTRACSTPRSGPTSSASREAR